jgi:predicted Zn-dependent peptidase
VIREEMRLEADSVQVVWDLFLTALWDGDPIARPVLGTAESLAGISIGALTEHARWFRDPERLVLAAAGDVDHDRLAQTVASRWGGLPRASVIAGGAAPIAAPVAAADATDGGGKGVSSPRVQMDRSSQQTHLAVGTTGLPIRDPRRQTLRLLEIVLGRGASSRLHRALRTDRGLVYSVSTVAMSYEDRGYFAVTTSSAPDNTDAVEAVIRDTLDRVARETIPDEELARAKMIYEGSLARQFETALPLASITGIEELLYRIEPMSDSVARTRALPADALRAVAAELFTPERLAVATVGRERWQTTPATTP